MNWGDLGSKYLLFYSVIVRMESLNKTHDPLSSIMTIALFCIFSSGPDKLKFLIRER